MDLDTPAARAKLDSLVNDHNRELIDARFGDLRDAAYVNDCVKECDSIIHMAAVIPPLSEAQPELARAVNIEGTKHLLAACEAQHASGLPSRFLQASSFDVFGRQQQNPPPRRVGDSVYATDTYTDTKLICEELLANSSLPQGNKIVMRFFRYATNYTARTS